MLATQLIWPHYLMTLLRFTFRDAPTSSHSAMASRAMRFASTSVSPSVRQAGSSGTLTQ